MVAASSWRWWLRSSWRWWLRSSWRWRLRSGWRGRLRSIRWWHRCCVGWRRWWWSHRDGSIRIDFGARWRCCALGQLHRHASVRVHRGGFKPFRWGKRIAAIGVFGGTRWRCRTSGWCRHRYLAIGPHGGRCTGVVDGGSGLELVLRFKVSWNIGPKPHGCRDLATGVHRAKEGWGRKCIGSIRIIDRSKRCFGGVIQHDHDGAVTVDLLGRRRRIVAIFGGRRHKVGPSAVLGHAVRRCPAWRRHDVVRNTSARNNDGTIGQDLGSFGQTVSR